MENKFSEQESGDRKRQRGTTEEKATNEDASSAEPRDTTLPSAAAAVTPATASAAPPPPYGSKQYWEDRYEQLKQDAACNNKKNSNDGDTKCNNNKNSNDGDTKNDADPFHAWYFNFEELAPLILPLILGDGNTEEEEEEEELVIDDTEKETDDNKNDVEPTTSSQSPQESGKDTQGVEGKDDEEEIEYEEIEGSEDEKEEEEEAELGSPNNRIGLALNGPISVVEIGCGDVPLGRDLVASILEMETHVHEDACNILEKVVCLDYSKNVIDAMKEAQQEEEQQQQQESAKKTKRTTIPLIYEVADARELPYEDESFELLLEKGTLDAMLSDRDGNGSKNCRKIVAECARVLTKGGCMVIISHLNAHVQTGLQWLNDVIMPGLQAGAGGFEWTVEVHGNEADIPSEAEDGEDDSYPESPGPAVYVIRKGNAYAEELKEKHAKDPPSIRLRFFTY